MGWWRSAFLETPEPLMLFSLPIAFLIMCWPAECCFWFHGVSPAASAGQDRLRFSWRCRLTSPSGIESGGNTLCECWWRHPEPGPFWATLHSLR